MNVYAGAPAAARHYVEADRGRADDYYLAEGAGVARRFTSVGGRVVESAPLAGDAYEAWVAGLDPGTGEPRGWLRTDEHAVRFVEVVVNGPKSWSLATALHPEITAAYEAAQDRAAAQVIGWLAEHATTRVGPRGGQVQVPVESLEAVTVRHYTSRAGDPHRHLHLQINARVFAFGKWRGLHTVGVRDSLAAINGIGHAAVACDPQFRAALAAHGFTLDGTGEIRELAGYAGPFSARAAQISRNVDRYEREWTAAHPGERPGPGLRRAWDARAWADGRPDKVTPRSGEDLTARWVGELAALGFRHRDMPVALTPTPVGRLDRERAVEVVLARLAAARSAWNAADVRGEVEQLIAAAGIVADPAVRIDLAEDLTARAMGCCLPLLDRAVIPEHIRAWTSQPVLEVEAELKARLAARAAEPPVLGEGRTVGPPGALPILRDSDGDLPPGASTERILRSDPAGAPRSDAEQAAAAAVLAGHRGLIVIEGAAGAGKTTTLAAAQELLARQRRELTVVTPTLKAAKAAAGQLGAPAGSAAWLVFSHGWRWTADGAWTRLSHGDADPVTGGIYSGPDGRLRLRPGDLLVVDEAGMLDQDTARALLTVADEAGVRVALLGDRHQLAAVGRGGVLDLAARAVDPAAHLTLAGVHRFTRADGGVTSPDTEYAELTLAMRAGENPGTVFDALAARGQICLHPNPNALQGVVAAAAAARHAAGEAAVVVDTREQAADFNAAIRDRLVAAGRVDDTTAVTTRAGQRIGVGDRIATRRNDRDLGVANRDTWTVVAVGETGALTVTSADIAPAGRARGSVTPAAVTPSGGARGPVTPLASRRRVLPPEYVTAQVELAYATTAHGVQGDTVPTAHVVVGEHTGAASAYVGMTRGRTANTAHLVAADAAEARERWIAVFGRDRADLGPAAAARQAAAESARYAPGRPFEEVLADLRVAWAAERRWGDLLADWELEGDILRQLVAAEVPHAGELARLEADEEATATVAAQARRQAEGSRAEIDADTDKISRALTHDWNDERDEARAAARVVLEGPGRPRLRRGAVNAAAGQLTDWGDRWRPHLPDLPTDPGRLAQRAADRYDDRNALWTAFDTVARRTAEAAHPDHADLLAAAGTTRHAHEQAESALAEGRARRDERLRRFGPVLFTSDPAEQLTDVNHEIAAAHQNLNDARARLAALSAEPAVRAQPADRLATEHDAWRAEDTERRQRQWAAEQQASAGTREALSRPPEYLGWSTGQPGTGPHMGR